MLEERLNAGYLESGLQAPPRLAGLRGDVRVVESWRSSRWRCSRLGQKTSTILKLVYAEKGISFDRETMSCENFEIKIHNGLAKLTPSGLSVGGVVSAA